MIGLAVAALLALPPADRLVEVSGVTLHLQCDGTRPPGAPLVVLEAGAGNTTHTWRDVFGPIAQFARVCAYDRQGMGTSGKAPRVPTFGDTVASLHALLEAAGERPPYVMAGHSYGGALIRLYAQRYPAEVRGLVLIDSSHEDQVRRFAAVPAPAPPPPASMPALPGLPAPVIRPMSEPIDLDGMAEVMSQSPWHANIPLVVLTRTAPADAAGDPRGAIWQELQRELATRSPQAEHIVAPNSGHYIQNDEPALVIDAIRRVMAKARSGSAG